MTDSLAEDAWLTCFLPAPPRPLLNALQHRLAASTTHVHALAEVYKQRAVIEAAYADSLAKLAKSAEQGQLLGKNGVEWAKGSGEAKLWDSVVGEIAESSTSHSTFAAILRTDFEQPVRDLPNKIVPWRRIGEQDASLDKTLKDYEKTSAKLDKSSGKKSSKTDALLSELNQLTASLSSLSPMVYTTFQRLDEERLKGLKEVIVRWGTVRADMAMRDGQRAERAVAGILGWETADEVLAVGTRLGGAGGARAASVAPPLGTSTPTPPTPRRMSSTREGFSPRPSPRQNGSSSNLREPPPSSFAGGIKSMLGRSKTLARGRSNSYATSIQSVRDREPGFDAIGESEEPPRTRTTGSVPPPVDNDGFSVAPADRHRSPWDEPDDIISTPSIAPAPANAPTTAPTSFAQTFSNSPTTSQENLSTHSSQQPRLNLAMAPAPIQESEEERQAALQKMQQTLAMPQQPMRRSTVARGRRDVRNTMFGGDLGSGVSMPHTPEASSELGLPLAPTANGLSNGLAKPSLPRQASMNSVTSNNPFDSPSLPSAMSSITPALPVMSTSGPGLRATMTESMNVIMRNGEAERVQINGEIHLGLAMASQAAGPIHIRLTSFEQLEKIAPNPTYLAQVPDRPGEYFLNSDVLASATAKMPSKGILLFKYQVHVPPDMESSVLPLSLDPGFLCKDGETRMILKYKANPASPIVPGLEALSNLSFLASFGPGPAVTNVQAKPPGGVWSPSTRRMTWKLDDASGLEGKIIARFTSDAGEALVPQGVQASWAVEGMLGSGLGIEIVGGQLEGHSWEFEEIKKALTTGTYLAEPTIN